MDWQWRIIEYCNSYDMETGEPLMPSTIIGFFPTYWRAWLYRLWHHDLKTRHILQFILYRWTIEPCVLPTRD